MISSTSSRTITAGNKSFEDKTVIEHYFWKIKLMVGSDGISNKDLALLTRWVGEVLEEKFGDMKDIRDFKTRGTRALHFDIRGLSEGASDYRDSVEAALRLAVIRSQMFLDVFVIEPDHTLVFRWPLSEDQQLTKLEGTV
jgi:hypothetical protein